MKTYSVKEISAMLNTNSETVRRWIRDKKLDATIESKKGGHMVHEAALREFLKSYPKYAASAKAALAGAAMASTIMVGGLIAQKFIDAEQAKQARVSNKDVIRFLQEEMQKCLEAIQAKENTIDQLKRQIEAEQLQVAEYKKIIDNLSLEKE